MIRGEQVYRDIQDRIDETRGRADRIGNGVDSEHAHGATLRSQQTEDVLDECRLAGAILADQAVDRPP